MISGSIGMSRRSPRSDQAPISEHKDVRVIFHVVEQRVIAEHDGT